MSGAGGPVLGWPEVAERLAFPGAEESLSALFGEGLLVARVEPGDAAGPAAAALGRLPCPTVAIAPSPAHEGCARLVDHFDTVLAPGEEAELAAIRRTVERAPLASLALAQLLRHGRGLSLHEALMAESWAYSVLLAGPEFAAWLAERGAPRAPEPDADAPLLVSREGGTLTLVLNRPGRRNAWCAAMRDACAEALTVALADDTVESIVLRGAGPAFCAGGDLDEFGTLPDPATAHAVRATRNVARILGQCAGRVHVRLHGACVGAGVELPALAHRVNAAPDAFFQLPELAMGLVPGAGGTASLPRRIGRQRAARMALTGERVDVETALAWGLVDAIEGSGASGGS